MMDDVKGWWAIVIGLVTGGVGVGVTARKVQTHDRVLFQEKGGLNVVDVSTCKEKMGECRRRISQDVGNIVRKELQAHNKQDNIDLILEELRKLNKKEE